ncbi:MAG: hypothetical protein JWN40_4203 [Phycisphaerales bacterium]|nr:hypothetical protein [Phycisphaerales bacterium]
MSRWCALIAVSLCLLAPAVRAADAAGFSFDDKADQYLDVLLDGKIVARYMYAHDTSSKEKRIETYKPYLHVFDAEGKAPITQGVGGKQFPHHRGIYIGWQKLGYEGKKYNFWEMAGGDIVHAKFSNQKADGEMATFTSGTRWLPTGSDKPVIEEERTLTFRRAPAPARLIIDFTSTLKAPDGDVALEGDPEHGGVQYRPAGDISAKETTYLYPVEKADARKDVDYPWVGETYMLKGKKYSVVEMSSPENPKGTRWSAYRDYGRFGAYPKASVKSGESLTVKFRFLIADGEMPAVGFIQKIDDQFTGTTSPPPKTTVKPAEGAKAPTPKKAAAAK